MSHAVTAFNGYPVSIFFATLLHGLVFAALFYFQQANTEVIDVIRPPSVKALLVAENPQARNEQVQQQQAQRAQEQRRQEQARQERAKQEQARQEQVKQEQAKQEQAKLEQAKQERAKQEQAKLEQAKQEQAKQEQAKQEQAKQEQAKLEQAKQEKLVQEQAQRDAAAAAASAELARTDAELVMAYSALVHDLVQRNWSRPPSARNGMVVVLRIQMAPTGDILNVAVTQSSGDSAFDRAAENAVMKVRRFTELQGMDIRLFERNFRTFSLTFRPQDLLN